MSKFSRAEIPTLEDVSGVLTIPELVGAEVGSIEHTIGIILIFSCFVGENIEQLHLQTGIPVPVIDTIALTLRKNGVFGANLDRFHEYFEDKHSGIALNLDISCGQDLMQRTTKNGEPAFKMTDLGVEFAKNLMATRPSAQKFLEKVIGNKEKAMRAYRKNKEKRKKNARK
jgi:hypothetical protein